MNYTVFIWDFKKHKSHQMILSEELYKKLFGFLVDLDKDMSKNVPAFNTAMEILICPRKDIH